MSGVHEAPLKVRVFQGAAMATAVMAFRVAGGFGSRRVPPWMAILTMVIAGGAGGAAYYALDGLRARGDGFKTLANVLSLLTYAFVVIVCAFVVSR